MPKTWAQRFGAFFIKKQRELATVLDAESCREGWVQGEMHLEFSTEFPGFCVGNAKLGDRRSADLACLDGPRMIGELKVLGSFYQPKVITGGSLRAIQPYLGRKIGTRQRRQLLRGPWGLVPDYFRLHDSPRGYRQWERLLVLVADVNDEDSNLLAETLRRVDFEGERTNVPLRRGFARIWSLP